MAVWEQDGCGTSEKWIRRVVEDFRREGTKDLISAELLTQWVKKLNANTLTLLYKEDKEAALEILVNCLGNSEAFQKYKAIEDWLEAKPLVTPEVEEYLKKECGWLDRGQINEVYATEKKKRKELEEDNSKLLDRLHDANEQCNNTYDQLQSAKQQITELKAQLYDAFHAGFAPDAEY